MGSWENIRESANEVERLIGHRQYNMAMIKARQTLEYMVKSLTEKCGLEPCKDLIDGIDNLYAEGVINKVSRDHYHRIRHIGNYAVHEGDDRASAANEAYHILSQELYTFAHDFSARKVKHYRNREDGEGGRTAARSSKRKFHIATETVFKIVIAIFIIVIIGALIVYFTKNRKTTQEVETELQVTVAETAAQIEETMAVTEPEPETEAVAVKYVITGDGVRVRSTPGKDEGNIIGSVSTGDEVEYLGDTEDGEWSKIMYNGSEAYVAKQFVAEQEVTAETETMIEETAE